MGLEDDLYGSQQVRNYLKLFSEHNWGRVSKATMTIGICRLMELAMRETERIKPLHKISVEELEEMAVKMVAKTHKRQKLVEQAEHVEENHKRYKRTEETSNYVSPNYRRYKHQDAEGKRKSSHNHSDHCQSCSPSTS